MSRGLTIQVEGLSKVMANIERYKNSKSAQISNEVKGMAYDIEAEAKTKAPVDLGHLRQSVRVTRVTKQDADIEVQANYAAFIEFGTGSKVNVPKDLTGYAIQFKGKGVKEVNLPARPFFFPAVWKNAKQMVENIKTILNRK